MKWIIKFMRRYWCFSLTLGLLLGLVLQRPASAAPQAPMAAAQAAAHREAEAIWPELSEYAVETFYGQDEQPMAHAFIFYRGEGRLPDVKTVRNRTAKMRPKNSDAISAWAQWREEAEFITVFAGAQRDLPPVLFMHAGLPSHILLYEELNAQAADMLGETPDASPRFYYLGPWQLLARFTAPAGSIWIDLLTRRALTSEQFYGLKAPVENAPERAIHITEQWRAIEALSDVAEIQGAIPMAYEEEMIDGVPDYQQDDYGEVIDDKDCGPVAAANVLGYWDDRGYWNLIDFGDSLSHREAALVYDLREAMDFVPGIGVNGPNLVWGMQDVCNDSSYGNNLQFTIRGEPWPTVSLFFSRVRDEVVASRPLVFMVSGYKGDPYNYGDHAVTVVGYREGELEGQSGTRWCISHDNWKDTPENVYVNWDTAPWWLVTISPGGDVGPALPAPMLSSPAQGSSTQDTTPRFDWEDIGGAVGYRIQADSNWSFADPEVDASVQGVSEYTPAMPMSPSWYRWRVTAINENGNASMWWEERDFHIPPAVPTELQASTLSDTQLALGWHDNSDDESEFRIERSVTGLEGWTQVGSIAANATSWQDNSALCGMTLYYRVRAFRYWDDALSEPSNLASATTLACTVPTFTISGYVKNSSNAGIQGVQVSAGTQVASTNSVGYYHITGLLAGSYSVIPTKSGYTFSPSSVQLDLTTNRVMDFTGTPFQADDTFTLFPTADTYLRQRDPTTPTNNSCIRAGKEWYAGHQNVIGLLKFGGLSTTPALQSKRIYSADLKLYAADVDLNTRLRLWEIGRSTGIWNESETYSSFPFEDTNSWYNNLGALKDNVSFSVSTSNQGSWITINDSALKSYFQEIVDSDEPNYGMLIDSDYSDVDSDPCFSSREVAGQAPQLILKVLSGTPDLVVNNIGPSPVPPSGGYEVGQSVRINYTVFNNGPGGADYSRAAVYLGTSSSDLSHMLDDNNSGQLLAGEDDDDYVDYVFASSDVGTRYLIVVADWEQDISDETNENNNQLWYGPFQVVQPNRPPSFTTLPNHILSEDDWRDNATDLWAYASDPDTPDNGLSFSIASTPDPGAGVSIDGNRYIDIQPATNWCGSTGVTVRVRDPQGLYADANFQVSVTCLNDQPWIAPPVSNQSAFQDQAIAVDLTSHEHDVEDSGTALDWYITGLDNCTVGGERNDDDVLTFTPQTGYADDDVITLHLVDSGGQETSQDVTLTWMTVAGCYGLTLTATGSDGNPVANPTHSADCPTGTYRENEIVQLTASPAVGWFVANWSGTDDDGSTALINTITMPGSNHSASVAYERGFKVTATNDAVDASIGDEACATAAGECTLRAAIQEANARGGADTIILPAGLYALSLAGAGEEDCATGDLDVTDDLHLIGAGASTTVIDAGGLDRGIDINDPTASVRISGLTIQKGNASDIGGAILNRGTLLLTNTMIMSSIAVSGGGIFHGATTENNLLTVSRSTIRDNVATGNGGGISSYQSSVTLDDTIVANNGAASGGGIYIDHTRASLTLTHTTLQDNHATTRGGAICALYSTVELVESTLDANQTDDDGGGIYGNQAVLELTDSTLKRNAAVDNGGGIHNYQGTLHINGGTALGTAGEGNLADSNHDYVGIGGAIYTYYGSVSVLNHGNLFEGNHGAAGGAIANSYGTVLIENAIMTGNSSDYSGGGGAIRNIGSMTLTNSTISGNTARYGGGIANFTATGVLTMTNVTVSNNIASWGADDGLSIGSGSLVIAANSLIAANDSSNCSISGTLTSRGHNLDSGSNCGFTHATDLTGVDARIEPLADNGGSTLTHALRTDSPAIDAGDDGLCPAADQVGRSRPLDGNFDGLSVCDIGAYESFVVGSLSGLSAHTTTSGDMIAEWTHSWPEVYHYEVWRAADPNFTPPQAGSLQQTLLAPTLGSGVAYSDANSGSEDFYAYVILGLDDLGMPAVRSGRIGAFRFPLIPGQ